jgi:cytochrome b
MLALHGCAPRYLGHNPLGGWMVLALIAAVIVVGATGWLYTTDAYWGEAWLEDLHDASAKALLALVALHVAGVIATSLLHRENLVAAMIHGRKLPPRQTDVA